jgi:hypothetical protein
VVAASIFSETMRQYSAGEHFPDMIKAVRRMIVSQA